MTVTTIDLLRHGATKDDERLNGNTDVALSEEGWKQLRRVIKGKSVPWKLVISSPLQRCAAFAKTLADRNQIKMQMDGRVREIDFGQWEGCEVSELYEREHQLISAFWKNPVENPAPAGESMRDFERRVFEAWEQLLVENPGTHILLITHDGPIRAILRKVLGFPVTHSFRIEVPHASLTRVRYDREGGPWLVFHGGTL